MQKFTDKVDIISRSLFYEETLWGWRLRCSMEAPKGSKDEQNGAEKEQKMICLDNYWFAIWLWAARGYLHLGFWVRRLMNPSWGFSVRFLTVEPPIL